MKDLYQLIESAICSHRDQSLYGKGHHKRKFQVKNYI